MNILYLFLKGPRGIIGQGGVSGKPGERGMSGPQGPPGMPGLNGDRVSKWRLNLFRKFIFCMTWF